ncbi:AMP-binding protein [Streptomyces sp. enrichment culture]|uniref:AMP-binding protein n=1 Tax=Streptomyces sp. enrichment culture TaxID=1795815 RepID=UPI003F565114
MTRSVLERPVPGPVLNRITAGPPEPGHRITFRGAGPTETYRLEELYDLAGRLALHLRRLGLRCGDRIGILARNTLEWVLLDLAALRLGVLTAGFEAGKFTADRSLLDRYGLALLFSEEESPDTGVLPLAEVRRMAFDDIPGELPAVTYAPDDETTLKFTSGSTGSPKGLAATAGSIDSSLHAVQEMFAHGDDDELFVFLPLSLLQQRYWVYSALAFGHDLTISSYASALPALRRTRPTVVMGVPAFYELARRHIEARVADVTGQERPEALRRAARRLFGERVRYLWTGSAPADLATLRFFRSCALPVYEGYGMNETCIVTKNHPGAAREGSVGRVVTGKTVLLDEHGNISVRSDFPVNHRYSYAEPGASERVFAPDGTVRTGDVGYLDDDGFLFITGRADDVIALDNGRNVAVRPIEDRLRQSPAIAECLVFSAGGELVAVVSPAGSGADEATITAHLRRSNARAARHERVTRAVLAPEPFSLGNGLLSSQYKPLRQKIRAAFAAELADRTRGFTA